MAALAVSAVGSMAHASTEPFDDVNMRFVGTGAGRAVGVQFWVGSTKVMDANVFAGSLNHQFSSGGQTGTALVEPNDSANFLNGRTVATFCTDILESVDTRWRVYSAANVDVAPNGQSLVSNPMGENRAGRLGQLYNFGLTNGLLNQCGGWANDDRTDGANRDRAAAWQLLVWEIVFGDAEDTNWDANGALRVSGLTLGVRNYFSQFRDLSEDFAQHVSGFRAAVRSGSQDQLVIIPLPPAVYAGLGMLGLMAGARYLRRRQARLA